MHMKTAFPFLLVATLGFALAGCEAEGPAEEAGESIDQTIEGAGEQMEQAGEQAGEQLER